LNNNIIGVYTAKKKDGSIYYRASITYKNKHISLGSSDDILIASEMYQYADLLTKNHQLSIDDYEKSCPLSFDKYVIIINFRDNNIYLSNPIYVRKKYISYYISQSMEMKFSIDDLFYYMSHKILRRGGHFYVNDYGMQVSLGNRYGIKNYAVVGKDYRFANGDYLDYRYENIEILNTFNGVERHIKNNKHYYKAKIHVNGDLVIGYYNDAIEAAIAYNKAIDILKKNGINKNFSANYIEGLSPKLYAQIYTDLKINASIMARKGI